MGGRKESEMSKIPVDLSIAHRKAPQQHAPMGGPIPAMATRVMDPQSTLPPMAHPSPRLRMAATGEEDLTGVQPSPGRSSYVPSVPTREITHLLVPPPPFSSDNRHKSWLWPVHCGIVEGVAEPSPGENALLHTSPLPCNCCEFAVLTRSPQ